jgi:hypothetical protein
MCLFELTQTEIQSLAIGDRRMGRRKRQTWEDVDGGDDNHD